MKLKFDDKGNVVSLDGKPVYVADDGKEVAFDYSATLATISRLNGEAKGHRERAEAAEAKAKTFEGIEDPAKAREAIEIVSKLDSKKLLDAGKVDEIQANAKKAYDEQLKAVEEKYKPVIGERDALRNSLHQEIVGGSFSRSKYIAEKLAIPFDLAQAKFGTAFSVEEGNKLVAKDAAGNSIYSRSRPGEIAAFDEAMEIIVDQYPYRDQILRGTGASGTGASPGSSSNGRKTMSRAQFDALGGAEKSKIAREFELVD